MEALRTARKRAGLRLHGGAEMKAERLAPALRENDMAGRIGEVNLLDGMISASVPGLWLRYQVARGQGSGPEY